MYTRRSIFLLSLLGLTVGSYLSAIRMTRGTCAFNEPCPVLFGVPAIYLVTLLLALTTYAAYDIHRCLHAGPKPYRMLCAASSLSILLLCILLTLEGLVIQSRGYRPYAFIAPLSAYFALLHVVLLTLAKKGQRAVQSAPTAQTP